MKNLVLFLFFTLTLFSCKKENSSPEPKKLSAEEVVFHFKKKLYQNEIDSIFKKFNFNGSIAIFQDSVLVYQKDQGFEDFKSKTKLSDQSIYAIGSVSKQFTAVLVLQLVQVNKLKLEDKVSKYLKEFQNKEYENITVNQLLNHTSGMNDTGEKLLSKSGKDFNYSNKGFYFLGKLIEEVSGKTYDENATEIFKRIGLNHSFTADHFNGTHFSGAHLGASKNPETVQNMPKRLADKSISVAAGGILSSASDLNRWNEKLYGGKIIDSTSLKNFTEQATERPHPIFGKMGYGLGIMMNIGKPKAYFHSGYVKGSASLNMYYPETKTSVIILTNIADESKGKNSVFQPHKEMKLVSDKIEIAASELTTQYHFKN